MPRAHQNLERDSSWVLPHWCLQVAVVFMVFGATNPYPTGLRKESSLIADFENLKAVKVLGMTLKEVRYLPVRDLTRRPRQPCLASQMAQGPAWAKQWVLRLWMTGLQKKSKKARRLRKRQKRDHRRKKKRMRKRMMMRKKRRTAMTMEKPIDWLNPNIDRKHYQDTLNLDSSESTR